MKRILTKPSGAPRRLSAFLPLFAAAATLLAPSLPIGAAGAEVDAADEADAASRAGRPEALFGRDNLWAWCVVPFDAAKRGPEERAAMLDELGFKGLAYDWRAEHIPTFGEEIDALRARGAELTAFWCPINLDPAGIPVVRTILDVLRDRKCPAQLWVMLDTGQLEALPDDATRVERAVEALAWLAREAEPIGSRIALYNHGGWFGEPENQIAIIQAFDAKHPELKGRVGIVYNLHHGHPHLDRFETLLAAMKPHLLCLNLNGMRAAGPKILPVGQGDDDAALLRLILHSGYDGPIGILDHLPEVDSREALEANLKGLDALLRALTADAGGARDQ